MPVTVQANSVPTGYRVTGELFVVPVIDCVHFSMITLLPPKVNVPFVYIVGMISDEQLRNDWIRYEIFTNV